MKVTEKCPKCNGYVQTKTIKKSIGTESVDVPIAQFCLNPECNWYQDFVQTTNPENMKEDAKIKIPEIEQNILEFEKPDSKKPLITKSLIRTVAVIIGCIAVYALFFYFVPELNNVNDPAGKTQAQRSELLNNSSILSSNISSNISLDNSNGSNTLISGHELSQPESYTIRIDVSHGFYPDIITINRSDTIVWSNEENQRIRIALVSKDGLFEYETLQYIDKFRYQFNKEGTYTFVLAEHPSLHEYENATGTVIVR